MPQPGKSISAVRRFLAKLGLGTVDISEGIFKGLNTAEIHTHYAVYIPTDPTRNAKGMMVWIIYSDGKELTPTDVTEHMKLFVQNIRGLYLPPGLDAISFRWGVKCGLVKKDYCHILLKAPDLKACQAMQTHQQRENFIRNIEKYFYD